MLPGHFPQHTPESKSRFVAHPRAESSVMAEAIVDVSELAQAIKAAVEETAPIKQVHISRYVAKTAFNPTGAKKRPKLNCTFLQNGYEPPTDKMFDEEIELVNQLRPGRYLDRKVEVIERIEGNERSIELRYSNGTVEQRMEMKNIARSLREMLRLIVSEQKPEKK